MVSVQVHVLCRQFVTYMFINVYRNIVKVECMYNVCTCTCFPLLYLYIRTCVVHTHKYRVPFKPLHVGRRESEGRESAKGRSETGRKEGWEERREERREGVRVSWVAYCCPSYHVDKCWLQDRWS